MISLSLMLNQFGIGNFSVFSKLFYFGYIFQWEVSTPQADLCPKPCSLVGNRPLKPSFTPDVAPLILFSVRGGGEVEVLLRPCATNGFFLSSLLKTP